METGNIEDIFKNPRKIIQGTVKCSDAFRQTEVRKKAFVEQESRYLKFQV